MSAYSDQFKNAKPTNFGAQQSFMGAAKNAPATKYVTPNPGIIGGVVNKAKAVTTEVGGMVANASRAATSFAANRGWDIAQQASLAAKSLTVDANKLYGRQANTENKSSQLDHREEQLLKDYKAGRVSKSDYHDKLIEISKGYQDLSKESQKIETEAKPTERGMAIIGTAATVLSTGRLQLAKAGAAVAESGAAPTVTQLIAKDGVSNLEKFMLKVPAAKPLLERNAATLATRESQKLAGETIDQYARREGTRLVIGVMLKQPIIYQQNLAGGQDVYEHILKGQYDAAAKSAAWMATQTLRGGPIGAGLWLLKKTGTGLSALTYGKGSFIDEVSAHIGDGNRRALANHLADLANKFGKDSEQYKDAEKVLRIAETSNLHVADQNVELAAQNFLSSYADIDPKTITPQRIVEDFSKWHEADKLTAEAAKLGDDYKNAVAVRFDRFQRAPIVNAVKGAKTSEEALKAFEELAGNSTAPWTQNDLIMERMRNIIRKNTPEAAAKRIQSFETALGTPKGLPRMLVKQAAKLGYTIALPAGKRITPHISEAPEGKLVSEVGGDLFEAARRPKPVFAYAGALLNRTGLSPQSTNQIAVQKLNENLVANLDAVGAIRGDDQLLQGQAMLGKLQAYIENKAPSRILNTLTAGTNKNSAIIDIRQLSPSEISEALGVKTNQARQISRAIVDAHLEVPLEARGLGDRVVDHLYQFNPVHKYYSRIQSALRYTYNPFFRTQERVETHLLSHAQGNNLVWMKSRDELDAGVKLLDDAGIFSSSFSGEGAQDQIVGRLSGNLTKGQKRDLAGLAGTIADQKGIPLQQMINDHPDELDDALRIVVQYPNRGVLTSSLARTMNLAFFPMRYNLKVTQLAAQTLARQPPTIQLAVVNSLFKMRDWLKSPEGIKWQAANQDALQVFNWLTPINSIEYTMNLLGHRPQSVGDFGQLGGLPLGVISQMLDSQGVINLNTPYVKIGANPDGTYNADVMSKYVPKTDGARAATALGDLLGSMFTYPGRILGLPGKQENINKAVKAFIATNGTDFDKQMQTDRLTPLQQNMIRVLKGDTSPAAIDSLYQSPAPGEFNYYTLPPLAMPVPQTRSLTTPMAKTVHRTGLPSAPKKTRAGYNADGTKIKKLPAPIPARQ